MKTNLKFSDMGIDEELLNAFQEFFADDPAAYVSVVRDTKRAFAYIRKIERERNPNND